VTVWDAATGAVVSTAGALGGALESPEWSPDGSAIAATLASAEESAYSARAGVLVTIPFAGARLGAPTTLVDAPPDEVPLHPSWSPDGKWIAFASVRTGGTAGSYGNRNTRLRLVEVATRKVHDLGNATRGGGLSATYPRFAPGQAGCRWMFIVFSSRLDYGWLRANSVASLGGTPQLWLSALDLGLPGSDPSAPPVWLPFQDPGEAAGNVLATWSARVPCTGDAACGAGAACQGGTCVVTPP
jgi:hypothetical protein